MGLWNRQASPVQQRRRPCHPNARTSILCRSKQQFFDHSSACTGTFVSIYVMVAQRAQLEHVEHVEPLEHVESRLNAERQVTKASTPNFCVPLLAANHNGGCKDIPRLLCYRSLSRCVLARTQALIVADESLQLNVVGPRCKGNITASSFT